MAMAGGVSFFRKKQNLLFPERQKVFAKSYDLLASQKAMTFRLPERQ